MTEYEFYLTLTGMIIIGIWGLMLLSYVSTKNKKNDKDDKK